MVIRRALGSREVHDGDLQRVPVCEPVVGARHSGRARKGKVSPLGGEALRSDQQGEESFKRSGRGEWIATAAPHPLFFGRQLAVQALTTFSCATGPVRHNLEQFEQRQLFGAGLQHPIE